MKKRLTFFIVALLFLSICLQCYASAATENDITPYATVIYPISGNDDGYFTQNNTPITLQYNMPAATVYRIDYAFWVENSTGTFSEATMRWRHNSSGETVTATFYNAPSGSCEYISLPQSGSYTVTISLNSSSTGTFYYAFNVVRI